MLNVVIVTGRLGADPELRYTPQGTAVCTFSLAVDRSFTNAKGERETDWLDVVVWRQAAESAAQHLKKGRLITVEGRIQTRTYEVDGQRRKAWEIVSEHMDWLPDGKGKAAGGGGGGGQGRSGGGDPAWGDEGEGDDVPF